MKKPVFSCLNVFEKRVTLHCHQQFEKFLYIVCIQSVRVFSSHFASANDGLETAITNYNHLE